MGTKAPPPLDGAGPPAYKCAIGPGPAPGP
jgi:hypothetical protein